MLLIGWSVAVPMNSKSRQSQWQQALRSESVKAAWEVFWQTTLDLHDAASAGNQKVWWPGYTRNEQEMQPVKAGKSVTGRRCS